MLEFQELGLSSRSLESDTGQALRPYTSRYDVILQGIPKHIIQSIFN